MPNYRRAMVDGGTFFFTVVTESRRPILTTDLGRRCLAAALGETLTDRPARVDAFLLMPDHLHTIWTLPTGDTDYSTRWSLIKRRFVRDWLDANGLEEPVGESRIHNRRRGVWQRRFWEHVVRRDEFDDIVTYIHLNPVKHGMVKCPHAWPWSSIHRWVREGRVPASWECSCDHARGPHECGPYISFDMTG
jgi:putative transposase